MRDGTTIVLRSSSNPAQLTTAMRGRIRAIDPEIPTTDRRATKVDPMVAIRAD